MDHFPSQFGFHHCTILRFAPLHPPTTLFQVMVTQTMACQRAIVPELDCMLTYKVAQMLLNVVVGGESLLYVVV